MNKININFPTPTQFVIGLSFAAAAAALFSVRPILVKLAFNEPIDSITLLTLRMLFAAPFYLIILTTYIHKKKLIREPSFSTSMPMLAMVFITGMAGYYASSLFDMMSLKYISAQLERMLLFTYPTLVALFGWAFFRQTISLRTIVSLVFSYLGIVCIFIYDLNHYGNEVTKGVLLMGLCNVTFAFYILFSKQLINKLGSRLYTCLAMISASIAVAIHFSIRHDISTLFEQSTTIYLIAFLIAVFCTVIPSFLINAAIAKIGPQQATAVSSIGPVCTIVLAVGLLGEAFTFYHVSGIVLVMIGISLLRSEKNKPNEHSS